MNEGSQISSADLADPSQPLVAWVVDFALYTVVMISAAAVGLGIAMVMISTSDTNVGGAFVLVFVPLGVALAAYVVCTHPRRTRGREPVRRRGKETSTELRRCEISKKNRLRKR